MAWAGPRRLLVVTAALLGLTVAASGCDSSPYAASVNGAVIHQTALNAALRQYAGNAAYVQLAKQGVVSAPVTVAGTGTGDLNAKFTAGILTQMILASAVHQELVATHDLPSAEQYAATRAVDGVLYGPAAWDGFSPAFRTSLVDEDADLAKVEPDSISAAQLQTAQTDYGTELFSNVCVRTVAVVTLAEARSVAAAIEASPSSATQGALACYDAASFETQSLSFVLTVLNLPTGRAAAPQKTSTGYTVTAVTSRTNLPADTALAQAFTVAVNQNRGVTTQAAAGVLRRAHVEVNPLYGTWKPEAGPAYGIVAPTPPTSGAAT